MEFNQIEKLILFGGSRLLNLLIKESARQLDFPLVVFAAPRHLEEKWVDGLTLRRLLESRRIKYYQTDDINQSQDLTREVIPNCLGLAIGAAWVFSKTTVALFKPNHLLDFMGIDLPRYRGGAHYSWQILHGNRQGCANFQVIRGGRETFHRGEIIKKQNYRLPDNLKTPQDYFNFISERELKAVMELLAEIKRGQDFEPVKLNEGQSSYYPFLSSQDQGLIDWSWTGEEIYLFISAFDEPYPGASTFINGSKVFLKGCSLLPAEEHYHPFSSGIVIRKNEQGIFAAARNGLLLLKSVCDEKGDDLALRIDLGDRFYTPSVELDKARQFRAAYNSGGLVK